MTPVSSNNSLVWSLVDDKSPEFVRLSERVWSTPEVCYQEHKSFAEHLSMLEKQGFRITSPVAGIPTAAIGEAGSSGPVLAILGEYDALPGLSQESGVAERRPLVEGGAGHGCGHNLLGSAALLAASAVKDWLEKTGTPGTVRYYACPAEEGGAAKAFMVREGGFADVDAAISWHPSAFAEVIRCSSLANLRMDFTFHGKAAHAGAAPHLGRSALDAIELMNVGVNYLREHMPSDARVHYAMIDGGGTQPNVVQERARVRYLVRAIDLPALNSLVARVKKIAEGAALMTETRVEFSDVIAVANLLNNKVLEDVMQAALEHVGTPQFDEADLEFARKIQASFTKDDIAFSWRNVRLAQGTAVLSDFVIPKREPRPPMTASTDLGDVSWVVPTAHIHMPTWAIGTPFHTWQMVAQSKMAAAHKGMIAAAKVMAESVVTLFETPSALARAKDEFSERVRAIPYVSPMPAESRPQLEVIA
jgi:aminobenzoyl-glutamate utilization protein B